MAANKIFVEADRKDAREEEEEVLATITDPDTKAAVANMLGERLAEEDGHRTDDQVETTLTAFRQLARYPQTRAVNVLLLDELNTPPASELRKEMIHYLASAKPETSLAIFSLTSRLTLVEGFTTDVANN